MEKNNTNHSEHMSDIQAVVMRRVHTIHAIRPLVSSTMLAALLSLGSLYMVGREVWVAKVFVNMPNPLHVASTLRFFEAAFFNTTTVVQVLCIVVAFSVVWILRDLVRVLRLPELRIA
ncbi:MAG: hypothetical protein AB202_03480 [Parcubacteria bacterium C7867-007]|nr:MAG: hypothetical protein AB202_03480 [Parcubacteria bacterium C7867-007]